MAHFDRIPGMFCPTLLFTAFADEIVFLIFGFLGALDVSNVASVCKRFYKLANDEVLWKTFYNRFYLDLERTIPQLMREKTWKSRFQRTYSTIIGCYDNWTKVLRLLVLYRCLTV